MRGLPLSGRSRANLGLHDSRGFAYFENGRFIPVSAVPGGYVHAIAGDGAGNLWISHQDHGLFHLLEGSVVEQIPWARLGRKDFAYALLPDPVQGGLWLGFYQGGVAYFKDGQVRASYASADGLGEGRVDGLQLDRDGTLWAATEGGLSRVKDGRVATLTSKNGLPCDTVHWVMEDDDHSFWLYTACGLVRIARPELDAWVADSKRTIQTTVFDSSDGVRSHADAVAATARVSPSPRMENCGSCLATASASSIRVTFPSTNSRRRYTSSKSPPTARRYEASSNLRLPPLIRDLEIDYTALSLVAPEKNPLSRQAGRLRSRLEGRGQSNGRRSIAIFLRATTASA